MNYGWLRGVKSYCFGIELPHPPTIFDMLVTVILCTALYCTFFVTCQHRMQLRCRKRATMVIFVLLPGSTKGQVNFWKGGTTSEKQLLRFSCCRMIVFLSSINLRPHWEARRSAYRSHSKASTSAPLLRADPLCVHTYVHIYIAITVARVEWTSMKILRIPHPTQTLPCAVSSSSHSLSWGA